MFLEGKVTHEKLDSRKEPIREDGMVVTEQEKWTKRNKSETIQGQVRSAADAGGKREVRAKVKTEGESSGVWRFSFCFPICFPALSVC